jgi:hypothetical protein
VEHTASAVYQNHSGTRFWMFLVGGETTPSEKYESQLG